MKILVQLIRPGKSNLEKKQTIQIKNIRENDNSTDPIEIIKTAWPL